MRLIATIMMAIVTACLQTGSALAAQARADQGSVAAPSPVAMPQVLTATDTRLAGDDKRTRLIVDLTGPAANLNFRA